MGLYDEIILEWKLPEEYESLQHERFQTKDFNDQYMREFHITANGLLIERQYEYEHIDYDELSVGLRPIVRRTGKYEDIDTEYHGDILFYTSLRKGMHVEPNPVKDAGMSVGQDWIFYEFIARFTHGVIEYVVPCETKGKTIRYELS